MRTGYLVAAVMLFASGGAAFAQSLDGVAEVTAAGGGANISARAAARIERRDDRRERRAAQLNALRTARGLQARGDAAAGAFAATGENSFEAASESAARLMFTAEDEAQPTDSDAPAGNEADPDDSPREKPIFYILPYVEGDADIQGDLVECYEDCEEPHPGDEETHATDRPYIYTLSNTDSEVFFRGNARHSAGAGLGLVWLDGRAMKPDAGHGHGGGDMSLRAAVFGEDGVQRSEVVVDDRVCECCPTAAAQTSEGILVAYRNRSADEVRDIFVSRLVSGAWTPPVPVHEDGWRIPGCPVNGPAVSASGRRVALAWFTVQEDRGRAFVAFSADAGRTFAPPVRVDDAMAIGRLDVELLDDGGAAVGWVEHAGERSQFRVRRIQPDGTRSASIVVAGLASGRTSGYPRLARHGRDLLFAWTEAGPASRVVTARAQLSESVSSRQ